MGGFHQVEFPPHLLLCFRHVPLNLGIEEQRIHAPREGSFPDVQIFVWRRLRKLSVVLMFQMFIVRRVFHLQIVDVGRDNGNCGKADIVGYLAPEIRGFNSMVNDGLLFGEESSFGLPNGFRRLTCFNGRVSAELRRAASRAESTASEERH